MRTNTDVPTATKITLTYDDDNDYWVARDEKRDLTVQAATREAVLEALDEAVATHRAEDENDVAIDSEDPFFSAQTFSSGRSDVSLNVNEHLTEGTYHDKVNSDEES